MSILAICYLRWHYKLDRQSSLENVESLKAAPPTIMGKSKQLIIENAYILQVVLNDVALNYSTPGGIRRLIVLVFR